MIKLNLLLPLLITSLTLTSICFADNSNKLKSAYGPTLKNVPFVVKYKFERETKRYWDKSSYAQREAFLNSFIIRVEQERVQDEARRKAKIEQQKQRANTLKQRADVKRNKLRDQQNRAQSIAKDNAARKRNFNSKVNSNSKRLSELRRGSR
jgi:DNA anti-recombination protein RmuC